MLCGNPPKKNLGTELVHQPREDSQHAEFYELLKAQKAMAVCGFEIVLHLTQPHAFGASLGPRQEFQRKAAHALKGGGLGILRKSKGCHQRVRVSKSGCRLSPRCECAGLHRRPFGRPSDRPAGGLGTRRRPSELRGMLSMLVFLLEFLDRRTLRVFHAFHALRHWFWWLGSVPCILETCKVVCVGFSSPVRS